MSPRFEQIDPAAAGQGRGSEALRPPASLPSPARRRIPVATALRRSFTRGYGLAELQADLLAGTVVGVVALPLSMALAIAVGAPPQHGLYTAIVAGALVALLGGCKFQVTGPTAAFVVILAPIVTKHGLSGLMTAGLMAGVMLVIMGLARLGQLIQYIPHPVTTGFTAGIATVIATLQVKDILGLSTAALPEHFTDKVAALWAARGTASLFELGVAASTLALLLLVPRIGKKVPAPLIAISVVSLAGVVIAEVYPVFSVATIGSRFRTTIDGAEVAGIPSLLPVPSLPWGDGLSYELVRDLLPSAFAIAMLGAIESLLSAVIADGMTGTKHDPDAELVGLGIGNIVAPLFGGIAATGALARTATNIRAGARSPIASVTHALVILLSILFLAPLVAYVPMASLAALLLLVAWNMSELHHVVRIVRLAPKSDVFVLLSCYGLTVILDMVVAVSAGVVLAAILFMRRMAELTGSRTVLDSSEDSDAIQLPKRVALYEVNGPLFFGAAQKAMDALHAIRGDSYEVMVLHLGKVPVIDSTGFVALENALDGLARRHKTVILAGPLPRPREIFDRARLHEEKPYRVHVAEDLDAAIRLAGELVRA
ncbi:C4-dicarboxylic acid transporter DauA [Sorangium sp. So ce315]|uniref:C4-dicarboxylic acid transporter DauA n=1 Tax=Sorangium sp. So ce315 TaxID=3133299 RepID=UPI003F609C86